MREASAKPLNRFETIPYELILLILSKIHDPKTLTRLYSVSKHLAAVVSATTSTIYLHVQYQRDAAAADGSDAICSQSHPHTPISAAPGLLKIFPKLQHVKVKLCCSPVPVLCMAKKAAEAESSGPSKLLGAVHLGSLYATKSKTGQLLRQVCADERSDDATTPSFRTYMLPFSSVSVVGASTIEARGVGSEKYKGKGMVFLSCEQAKNIFRGGPVDVEEEWLSKNAIYWDEKKSQFSEDSWELSEHLWAVAKEDDGIITQEDVKQLLDGVGDDGDRVCF